MFKQQSSRRLRAGRLLVGILLAACLPLLVVGNNAGAQDKLSKIIDEPTQKLVPLVETAEKDGFTLFQNKLSIAGGLIKKAEDNWIPIYSLQLVKGKKYRFLAAGDFNAEDVDLRIKDDNNNVVKQDAGADPTAIVDYIPKAAGKHTIEVRLFASKGDVSCVVLSVALAAKK